jgi:hypothetical protein
VEQLGGGGSRTVSCSEKVGEGPALTGRRWVAAALTDDTCAGGTWSASKSGRVSLMGGPGWYSVGWRRQI